MFNTFGGAKSQSLSTMALPNIDQMLSSQQKHESLHRKGSIHQQRFELNSLSLKNFILIHQDKEIYSELEFVDRHFEQEYVDDPLYSVLSLKQGKSQYLQDQAQYAYQQSESPTHPHSYVYSEERKGRFDSFPQKNIHQYKDTSIAQSDVEENFVTQKGEKKTSTKNVTKNMGKLLFKFIWKNRMQLCKQLNVDSIYWENFMTEIRGWKKTNNITREYLNNRWHSQQRTAKLFRTISQYFFRKRCLSAIMQSNIQNKEMHVQRLKRFQNAIWDPNALDSLN